MQDYSKSLIKMYVKVLNFHSLLVYKFFLSFLSIQVAASLSVKKLSKMHKYAWYPVNSAILNVYHHKISNFKGQMA